MGTRPWLFVSVLVVQLVALILDRQTPPAALSYRQYAVHVLAIVYGALVLGRSVEWDWRGLGLRLPPRRQTKLWLVVATIFLIGATALVVGVFLWLQQQVTGAPVPLERIDLYRLTELIVVAPLLEEALHRGIVVNTTRSLLNERWAVLMSGVTFAVVHILKR